MLKHGILLVGFALASGMAAAAEPVRTGEAAYGDWTTDAPGIRRHITAKDLPAPLATKPAANRSQTVKKPGDATPKVPAGFKVEVLASGLDGPRTVRVAPNGDVFVAETGANRVRVFREGARVGEPARNQIYVDGLNRPFGIAFGPNPQRPQYLYIANTDSVVRFAYRPGDLQARGKPETIVAKLPTGGHGTRDIRFSRDGAKLFISVGSRSNVADDLPALTEAQIKELEQSDGLGAAWDSEDDRASVLVTNADGTAGLKHFANGIRNCSGLGVQPDTGDVWCVNNERDNLGDNLPVEYATRVQEGKFYGWPWYYIGANPDPRHKANPRPDLAGKVTVPDVLIQPHSAPLQITFYDGVNFPEEYRGDAFVTLHGSWNRLKRTGYKVVRLPMKDGKPTGEYEDFLVGLVADDANVWGRPVGIDVGQDGSLLVSEDANGTIWKISWQGDRQRADR